MLYSCSVGISEPGLNKAALKPLSLWRDYYMVIGDTDKKKYKKRKVLFTNRQCLNKKQHTFMEGPQLINRSKSAHVTGFEITVAQYC